MSPRVWLLAAAVVLLLPVSASADAPVRDRVFEATCVSTIAITAPDTSIAQLYADPKGAYQPATLTFDTCGAGVDLYGPLNVTFRLKGSGSFRTLDAKAALKVKLPSGNRIDGIKNLTLNNMVQDPSMVHEALAYKAFRAVGVKAPRVGYATVSINGTPYGLYANVETPDSRFLEANYPSTQHLYEAPDWTKGHLTPESRDVLPGSVANFEIDEGDAGSSADLELFAGGAVLADDAAWWDALQQNVDIGEVLRFWATELFVGKWDGYVGHVNNYFLHSTADGRFRFLPWGADEAFTREMALVQTGVEGALFDRCMRVAPCLAEYELALADAAERVLALDLVSEAHAIHGAIAPAVDADPRKEMSTADQCRAVNATTNFLLRREAVWRAAGETPTQSDLSLTCPVIETVPVPAAPTDPPVFNAIAAGVAIERGARFAKRRRVALNVRLRAGATGIEVSNDRDFKNAKTFLPATILRWTLTPATRTNRLRRIYLRFVFDGGLRRSRTYTDSIILATS